MNFFHPSKPIFLKNDSSLVTDLERFQQLKISSPQSMQDILNKEEALLKAGIAGEKNIEYELSQARYPMAVLHDLYLVHEGQAAQIDYLVVTRGCTFVLESKNLVGEITVDNKGEFTRKITVGNRYYKEGIYSPVTQNKRHLDLLKDIVVSHQSNFLKKSLVSNHFNDFHKGVVVFANSKCVINDRYAPKEIKQQLIKADRIVAYMHEINSKLDPADISSEKEMMSKAEGILKLNQKNPTDYLTKFERMIVDNDKGNAEIPKCPKCGAPMVKRIAKKGMNAGREFYGCSRYPECNGIVNI